MNSQAALKLQGERLREQGYDPHEEDFEENGRAAYVTDPDGNIVELWTWEGGSTTP